MSHFLFSETRVLTLISDDHVFGTTTKTNCNTGKRVSTEWWTASWRYCYH